MENISGNKIMLLGIFLISLAGCIAAMFNNPFGDSTPFLSVLAVVQYASAILGVIIFVIGFFWE